MDTEDVVAEINVALGIYYRCVRRLAGGLQSGAFELAVGTTSTGAPYQVQSYVERLP